ncbi:vomeronasal secretory protein 2-like, partial [Mus pahari]|uniref:vomeronasal secretory protein 2-like n=1 Tax=Mus pahari TaxID=10093 RepID=UPI000A30C093
MKCLLLTIILFGLLAVLQAQDELPFLSDEKKLSGVWFLKATVRQMRQTEGQTLVAFPYRLTCLEEGTLELRSTFMSKGRCIKMQLRMQKTKEPGQYSIYFGHNLFNFYELPEKDHYIVYMESVPFEKKFQEGHLIGKCPEENLEALEQFKEFIQCKGLLQENIIVPEQR